MGLLDKFKNFTGKINELEHNINVSRQDYLEVYERNLFLEKEIAERTQELNQANKTIITLQLVWDMMNSSTPLSSVLQKIVSSLTNELNYSNSTILKYIEDDSQKYFKIIATSESYFIKYNPDNILAQSLNEKKILHSSDYLQDLVEVFQDVDSEYIRNIKQQSDSHGMIVCPIIKGDKPFGCLLVFSTNETPQENELTFLTLFAQQIELAITIADLFEEVKKQAITDGLTDLYNRRYFENALKNETERALRSHQPFSLISLDLDNLKKINDTYGHNAGDEAIKTIADVLKRNARSVDIPARFGGEEFSILLPGIDSNGARAAAERIRTSLSNQIVGNNVGQITASIGVATFLEHTDNIDDLVELADQAMYKAKINGRNQVVVARAKDTKNWQQTAIDAFIDILSKNRIPVDRNTAIDLCAKLGGISASKCDAKELIYSIVDVLAKTYNPSNKKGATKAKVSKAIKLARRLELPKEDIDKLRIATLLYDIGNIMISDEIFTKQTPLTEAERKQIQKHPLIAAKEILKPISSIADVIPIIEHHHENWDGTGYPQKISGNDIPIESQIILLIDSFTALTQKRAYRDKLSTEEALKIIQGDANKKWNAVLVEEFVNMIQNEE